MIISFLNQKGGVGKSTAVIHLALAIQKHFNQPTLLIDADPQESTLDWYKDSKNNPIDVITIHKKTLDNDIKFFKKKYDFILIDGPGSIEEATISIAMVSDVILIPIGPSKVDVKGSRAIVGILKKIQQMNNNHQKIAFLICKSKKNTVLSKKIYELLEDMQMPMLKNRITDREIYKVTIGDGNIIEDYKDHPKIISEIDSVLNELMEFSK